MQVFQALLLACWAFIVLGLKREYFIAMEESVWDYNSPESRPTNKQPGPARIGGKYKKAVYRQYTDSTFTIRSPRMESLGLFGPIIRAEVKDTMIVHAFNRASRPYSIHPHGVFYKKSSEGALYSDNTTTADKVDDAIPPGEKHTYVWEVRDEYAPGSDDPNCLPWAYHSHVYSTRDQNTGLIGTLLTCKKGTLTSSGHRTDVDREFAIIIQIIDENESWYIDENILTHTLEPETVDKRDPGFMESNIFHTMNGLLRRNLLTEMCQGDLVHWYFISMGSDIHTIQITGNTAIIHGHRADTITLMPATFTTAIMRAYNPGTWPYGCHITQHLVGGMVALYKIHETCRPSLGAELGKGLKSVGDKIRTYYVAAEEIEWNFAPNGMNRGKPVDEPGTYSYPYFKKGPDRIGGTYIKAVYREYTDESFKVQAERDPTMGILGPVISAEVGETIHVVFKNNLDRVSDLDPHGVFEFERILVEPGNTSIFKWPVPDAVSPLEKDDNCILYMYSSLANIGEDQHTGLFGPMVICKRGTLESEMKKKVYYLSFVVFDENESPYLQRNIDRFASDPSSVDKDDEDFKESNRMRTINGLMFANLPDLQLCAQQYTDIRLLTLGSDINVHSFVMGSAMMKTRAVYNGFNGVFPHATTATSVFPYESGRAIIICHTSNHMPAIYAFYEANYCGDPKPEFQPTGRRTYYVGIVEEYWDYLPRRFDQKGNSVDNPEHLGYLSTHQESGKYIGSKYKKAIYHEYTDETFTVRKPKPEYLGFDGPILKAEIGDEVRIVFKNMAARRYFILATGTYVVGNMNSSLTIPNPGETVNVIWQIRPELTPSPEQPDCFATSYISTVDPAKDIYSGARGPLVICRKGTLNQKRGGMADVEFSLLFSITDENMSHYIDDNIREFAKADPEIFDKKDKSFIESNKMNHINGYMYHVPGLKMNKGDLVRWHLFAEGEEEIHAVHFHANAFVHQSNKENRGDVFDMHNGKVATLLMRPDAVGEWLLHCHVNSHVDAGMVTAYTVQYQTVICQPKCDSYVCTLENGIDCSLLGIGETLHLLNEKYEIKVKTEDGVIFVPANIITKLDLSHNADLGEVGILKRTLSKFPRLHTLWLMNIHLRELPGNLFEANRLLRVVNLKNNYITYLPGHYGRQSGQIEVLDLRNNKIDLISPSVFVGRGRRLKKLDLRGNGDIIPICLNAQHVDLRTMFRCVNHIKFVGIPKSRM